jgi:4-hydroxy-tetrahydrodipicolinate synthase
MADTVQAMAEDGSIIGMKYSSYDMPDFIRTVKYCGDKIGILSGEEPLFATHVALGAKGGVLASATDLSEDLDRHLQSCTIRQARGPRSSCRIASTRCSTSIFLETNPGPLKTYMGLAGMPVGGVRLPLMPPLPETFAKLKLAAERAKAVALA